MVPRLEERDAIVGNDIDKPVLAVDASGPGTLQLAFQWLGFSQTDERVAEHGFDERKQAEREPSVGLDPEAQVGKETRMKPGLPVAASSRCLQNRGRLAFFESELSTKLLNRGHAQIFPCARVG